MRKEKHTYKYKLIKIRVISSETKRRTDWQKMIIRMDRFVEPCPLESYQLQILIEEKYRNLTFPNQIFFR